MVSVSRHGFLYVIFFSILSNYGTDSETLDQMNDQIFSFCCLACGFI